MQTAYTVTNLLSELQTQGVIIRPAADENLYVDGEMTIKQLEALKILKPGIRQSLVKSLNFRFAKNEYLLWDLETCLKIFSVENESACRVAEYIARVEDFFRENCKDSICLCYPTSAAYTSALKLADGVVMNESGEITDRSLKVLTDAFIKNHLLSNQIISWMQEKDAPLWAIKIFHNGEQLETLIGNTVQVAIAGSVWPAINPECHHEIEKA